METQSLIIYYSDYLSPAVLHTSASLALNESWDPDVRDDMEMMLNKIVPEGLPYRHSCEGPDDMVSSDEELTRKLYASTATIAVRVVVFNAFFILLYLYAPLSPPFCSRRT